MVLNANPELGAAGAGRLPLAFSTSTAAGGSLFWRPFMRVPRLFPPEHQTDREKLKALIDRLPDEAVTAVRRRVVLDRERQTANADTLRKVS